MIFRKHSNFLSRVVTIDENYIGIILRPETLDRLAINFVKKNRLEEILLQFFTITNVESLLTFWIRVEI